MTAERLSPTTAALLLVDQQTGVLERVVKAPPREAVEANVLRLARRRSITYEPRLRGALEWTAGLWRADDGRPSS